VTAALVSNSFLFPALIASLGLILSPFYPHPHSNRLHLKLYIN
jgi:hypothetical protein